jgi:hypothetical protein
MIKNYNLQISHNDIKAGMTCLAVTTTVYQDLSFYSHTTKTKRALRYGQCTQKAVHSDCLPRDYWPSFVIAKMDEKRN